MKNLLAASGFVCLVALAYRGVVPEATGQEKAQPPVAKWEYSVETGNPVESRLNQSGNYGWELVSYHGGPGPSYLIFKRPKR
jgi:hypothetical protein